MEETVFRKREEQYRNVCQTADVGKGGGTKLEGHVYFLKKKIHRTAQAKKGGGKTGTCYRREEGLPDIVTREHYGVEGTVKIECP